MKRERSRLVRRLPERHESYRITVGDTGVADRAAGILRDALEPEHQAIGAHGCRLAITEPEFLA